MEIIGCNIQKSPFSLGAISVESVEILDLVFDKLGPFAYIFDPNINQVCTFWQKIIENKCEHFLNHLGIESPDYAVPRGYFRRCAMLTKALPELFDKAQPSPDLIVKACSILEKEHPVYLATALRMIAESPGLLKPIQHKQLDFALFMVVWQKGVYLSTIQTLIELGARATSTICTGYIAVNRYSLNQSIVKLLLTHMYIEEDDNESKNDKLLFHFSGCLSFYCIDVDWLPCLILDCGMVPDQRAFSIALEHPNKENILKKMAEKGYSPVKLLFYHYFGVNQTCFLL